MLPIQGFPNFFLTFRYKREADGSKTPMTTTALVVIRVSTAPSFFRSQDSQYVFAAGTARYNPEDRAAGLPLSKEKGREYALAALVRTLNRKAYERTIEGRLRFVPVPETMHRLATAVVNTYAQRPKAPRKTDVPPRQPADHIRTQEDYAIMKFERQQLEHHLRRIVHIAQASNFSPVSGAECSLLLADLVEAETYLKRIIAGHPLARGTALGRFSTQGSATGRLTSSQPNFEEIPPRG